MISATGATKYLDKSKALIPWAVGLVGNHIKNKIESSTAKSFLKEEIFLLVDEAIAKPEEAKVKGGEAGTLIHDYAYDFAKAVIGKLPLPTLDHLDKENETHAKALNGISAFLDWYNGHKVKFFAMEQLVYYNSFLSGDTKKGEEVIEFFGIIDLFAEVDKENQVIDYKSSKGVYSDQRYQVSCYFKGWNANTDNKKKANSAHILNFNKETGDLIEKNIPAEEVEKDFKAFKGLLVVANREKELDAKYQASKKAQKNESN
jgi:hypothetical protein